jgi:heptosyltransferase-2
LRRNYDCSINFYPSNRRDYNLASFLAGCKTRIGHRYVLRDLQELNFLKNKTVKEDDSLHNVQENLRLLQFLGIKETTPYSLKIYLTQEEKTFAHNLLHERSIDTKLLIGLHPGTSSFKNHDKKRWPEASFSRLIDMFSVEVKNSVFLLFGGPEEQSLRDVITGKISDQKSVLSVNPVSLRQAVSLMARCTLFISNDSGPMHMAAAVGVPIAAIFGPTNPAWVKPWGVKNRVVRSELSCSPCFRYSPKPLECIQKIDFACLKEISPDDTLLACLELIKEAGQEQ